MIAISDPIKSHLEVNQRYDEVRNNKYVILYRIVFSFLDKFCRGDLFEYDTEEKVTVHHHDRSSSLPNTSTSSPFNRSINSSVRDIYARRKTIARAVIETAATNRKHFKRRWAKMDFTIVLSRLLLFHYIITTIGLSTSIYYQYIYDYYVYHKRRLIEAQTNGHQVIVDLYASSNITLEKIEQQITAAKRDLKFFGSPLMEATYLAESIYLLMIMLALISYFAPLLYFRHNGPFDYYFVRMMMDWPKEQAKCNSMLREQVACYLESSRNYTQIALDQWRINNMGVNNNMNSKYSSMGENSSTPTNHDYRRFSNYRLETGKQNYKLLREKTDQLMDRYRQQHDYIREHQWTSDKLMDFYEAGQLQPFNRSNPKWIIKMVTFLALFSIGLPAGCFTWNIFLFSTLPYFSGFKYESDPMDIWAGIELGSLNIILTIGGLFYLSLSSMNCIEQVYVVHKLQAIIDHFVDVNMRLFHEHVDDYVNNATADHKNNVGSLSNDGLRSEAEFYEDNYYKRDDDEEDDDDEDHDDGGDIDYSDKGVFSELIVRPKNAMPNNATATNSTGILYKHQTSQSNNVIKNGGGGDDDDDNNKLVTFKEASATKAKIFLITHRERMNRGLLYIMIHYKIFIAQLKPTKKTTGFVCLCSLGLMTIFPVLARLHLPYIKDPAAKVLSIIVVLLMAGFADCCMIPVCWKNSRCLGLYKSLSRLSAHLVELSNHPDTGQLFDGHTFWLLRKELSHPECLAGQFATSSWGFMFTYQELLRTHFWVGLVAISIYFGLRSGTGDLALGNFLNDPLGIEHNLPIV